MSGKYSYYIIYKPYKVLSQFTSEDGNAGLSSLYKLKKDVYPVGRLDLDSEGLLILTNDKNLNNRLLNPKYKHIRTYWVEVEGVPSKDAIKQLEKGVVINLKKKRYKTQPASVKSIQPDIIDREPPVNKSKHPVRSWLGYSWRKVKIGKYER